MDGPGRGRRALTAIAALALLASACSAAPPTLNPTASASTTATGPSQPPPTTSQQSSPSPGAVETEQPIGGGPIGGTESQPNPEDWSPTSVDLILADVEAGRIDGDTGLLYRIFASFGDDRLPSGYASTQLIDIDQAALDEAAYRLENNDLPAAMTDQIRPYLLRPTNPESAFYGQAPTAARAAAIVPAVYVAQNQPNCDAHGWASLKSTSQPVKVWVRCDDPRVAGLLSDALDASETLYSEQSDTELMGSAILDEGALLTDKGIDAGGDNSIDIYFTSRLECVHRAGDCTTLASLNAAGMAPSAAPYAGMPAYTSSGYIVIDRARGDSKASLWDTMAHEMFHVLQKAHNVGGTIEGGRYHWFVEASATWAEQYFVPDARSTNTYPWFNRLQTSTVGLASVGSNNEYASFAWPYFMEQKSGWTSVGQMWQSFNGKMGWEALNAAMASNFSFEEHYKDFAVQAINKKLIPGDPAEPEMQVPDASFPHTAPDASYSQADQKKELLLGTLEAKGEDDPYQIPVKVAPLGVHYDVMGVGDSIAKIVFDFTGVQPSQALDVEGLIYIRDKGWERQSFSDGKTTFCRDRPDEIIDAAILVIANHSWVPAEKLTGTYEITTTDKPCADGTYKMDLASTAPEAQKFRAGHYDGSGDIECVYALGSWLVTGTVDDKSGPSDFDITDEHPVGGGGSIHVDFLDIGNGYPSGPGNTDPWFIIEPNPAYNAAVSLTVDTTRYPAQPATFKGIGTQEGMSIAIEGTCAHVEGNEAVPSLP